MHTKLLILGLGLLIVGSFGQTNQARRLFYPFLTMESQTNLVITADPDHPRICPLELTNLFSNTNLFSLAEQQTLRAVELKYKNVSTNAGAPGSVFKGMEMRQWSLGNITNTFSVACFDYTNSHAKDEIQFSEGGIRARFRTPTGSGYDVMMNRGRLGRYQEYAGGVLNGLDVGITDKDHCNSLARFVDGKLVGRFISWSNDGKIGVEFYCKEPFDFLKYQTIKHDMAWVGVTNIATDSTMEELGAPARTNSPSPPPVK